MDLMLSMYAEDAISLPDFEPRVQGIEQFRKRHDEMAGSGMKITAFDSQPTDVWACGNQVIEIGTFTISLDMPGMGEVDDRGKDLTICEPNSDGILKVKVETWNSDLNPMEMGGGGQATERERTSGGRRRVGGAAAISSLQKRVPTVAPVREFDTARGRFEHMYALRFRI